jgi:hypothetical protein
MPRLRDSKSGAVVSVSAETAARLGGEWEPAEKAAKKAPAKKAAAKSSKK